jgi:hypothetical protein
VNADDSKGIGFERRFFVWMSVVLAIGLWMTATAFASLANLVDRI